MGHPNKPKQILGSSKLVALNILESVAALAYLCAKYTSRASKRLVQKAVKPRNKRVLGRGGAEKDFGEESFGEGGVWRRSILMGDKCEPLDFSGVIYYDSNGNKLPEPPMKSPRASPFIGHGYPTAENY
uniref:Transmembrane protein n=1 Tax=Chenopodium quinoa TaxID=63459 RepID=A0A803MXL4_CHEQI